MRGMVRVDDNHLLGKLLKNVSRSFYLTLRVLPQRIRPQIGTAYLLARTADTIADTELLESQERLDRLLQFRGLLRRFDQNVIKSIIDSVQKDKDKEKNKTESNDAEENLFHWLEESFHLLASFPADDRTLIAEVVDELTIGMELDLKRFANPKVLTALTKFEDLEEYTYHVAGCVGPFWTKMCVSHIPAFQDWDLNKMCALGKRFGKALQWTNILRDIPRDLRNGRCYLPSEDLKKMGLAPADLKNPATYEKLRPLYFQYIDHALEHYRAAWEYILAIPKSNWKVRLACIWPVWIGLETLALLRDRACNPLEPTRRIRIPRSKVYRIIASSVPRVFFNSSLNSQYRKLMIRAASEKNTSSF
jgi:farnesyl-diphosphate farnesyltransferase